MPLTSLARRGVALGFAAVVTLPADAPRPPRLEVLVVIDQFRGDYFDRYGAAFDGGLARFAREGVVFTDAHQDHAITETAPGHATTLSGRSPASTGILANRLGVLDSASPLLGVKGPGASPRRFQGTTLADWLRARDSATRVLSVSRKDRGAILPIGRAKTDVYWYESGRFTTSAWYRPALPAWLDAWNARRGAAKLAGRSWTLSRPESDYPEPDSMAYENGGRGVTFPHRFPADTAAAEGAVGASPWADSLTLDVALEGVRVLQLGRRAGTDLLVVSLSATDAVGHRYGPDSRELRDHLLRLDGWLGTFLDSLGALVPAERTVFVLTADHGVQPFPERGAGGRASLTALLRDTRATLQLAQGAAFGIEDESGLVLADTAALRAKGVSPDSLAQLMARAAEGLPGVRQVFTPASLAAAPPRDEEARLWRKAIPGTQPWLVAVSLQPGWQWSDGPGSTGHGTTNRQDTHVALAVLRPGVAPARVTRRVTTEDIGPTLAALAGVRPSEAVTGQVLPEIVKARTTSR
jgi:arylsulfatase A-like enzyme